MDERDAAFGNAAFPEYGGMKRIASGSPEPMDAMLLLYFLNLRVPGAKPDATPKEEPAGGNKEEPVAAKEEQSKPKEEEVKPVENGKPAENATAKSKDGKAYEKGTGTKPKPKEKLQAGTPEHKQARWEAYQKKSEINYKKSYEEWSNRYDANMKNPGKGNKSADEYQQQIGWGKREVPMKIDENGNPIQVRKGQETRNLDIGDVPNKKAVEVKDYSSKKVPFDKDIKAEVNFDKKLVDKGWDVEWVFKDRGPSKALEEALNSPPPIKIKLIN